MDDFRVGSVSPYDPIDHQRSDDAAGRRKKKHSDQPNAEGEDVVAISEHSADDEEPGGGYGPHGKEP